MERVAGFAFDFVTYHPFYNESDKFSAMYRHNFVNHKN